MNINQSTDVQIDTILKRIEIGIKEGKEISYFQPYYKILSPKTLFIGSTILNEWFYRARLLTDKLFEHVNELKYPPKEFAVKGRLNDDGEQITYLSTGEVAPILELDIGYYQPFCMVKIRHVMMDTIYYYVGVKGQYESNSYDNIAVNNFYTRLLTSMCPEYYNATIALGRHFLQSNTSDINGKPVKAGIIYNCVHEDKSNRILYNIALYPDVFDTCCRIEEAFYYVLTYAPKEDIISMNDMNKGIISLNGNIKWKKSYSDMIEEYEEKYSNDIFKMSYDSIIHYKYGVGKIVEENKETYIVNFPRGTKPVLKKTVIII